MREVTISQSMKSMLATINWTAAVVLLCCVTLGELPLVFAAWSVLCALWGSVFIGWALLVRERLALERLTDLAIEAYRGTRLHPINNH